MIKTKVAASSHFIHWIMALGAGVQIIAPEHLVEEIRTEIKRLADQYGEV